MVIPVGGAYSAQHLLAMSDPSYLVVQVHPD